MRTPSRARDYLRLLSLGVLSVTTLMILTGSPRADDGKARPNSGILMSRDLPGAPGKEALVITVEYPPGGASAPHRHDASVFVYVLEGSVVMQVDGKPAETLAAGQTFYEGPDDVHRVSKNASATQPAKLLVFMVKDKGKPATRLVPSGPSSP